ncbi:hypothetical protein, partial [Ferroplasma sp.]|uniref:hypothetical protein n=1 Tax=Ferroplasma sp. TaxID=2591003 RepID=UPI00260BE9BB
FGVLTNATGGVLQNNLSDAYAVPQYVDQNSQVLSRQISKCIIACSEPAMQSAPNGGRVSFQARALQTTSKKSIKAHHCKIDWYKDCMDTCKGLYDTDLTIDSIEAGVLTLMCITNPLACVALLVVLLELALISKQLAACKTNCLQCKLKDAGQKQMPAPTRPCDPNWQNDGTWGGDCWGL